VAVVAARGHIDAAAGRLAVDRPGVDLDRVVDENVVLRRDVEILVTLAAGLGEVGRVDRRALGGRRQDVVVAVAVGAVGHVLARAEPRPAVGLVILRGLIVADAARLAADEERLLELPVRHRAQIQVAIETLETIMRRMRNVLS